MKTNWNPILIALAIALIFHATFGQPMMPPAIVSTTSVSNAPVIHNPRVLQMDGYSNMWLSVQSCTNLSEGKWVERKAYFFPTNFNVDMTNPMEFWKVDVKHRTTFLTN